MLSFVDHLSDGQFAAVFLIAILATLYVVGEFDAWAARKVAQHRARTFAADHARERIGVPLAGAERVRPPRKNGVSPLVRDMPRQHSRKGR